MANPKSKISFSDVTAIPAPAEATGLTKSLVRDDEVVILMIRPSWLYILLSSAGGLLFVALVTFALAYMAKFMSQTPGIAWTDTQAFMLGIGLAALRVGWQVLEWVSRVYILTDRRVICRSGVLRATVFETPLKTIKHVSVFARLRERMFGLGTIGFATAGSETFVAYWVMIRQPFAVHKTIVQAIERYGS